MISSSTSEFLTGAAPDLAAPDIEAVTDELAEAASERINARRALEENIEILRFGRAL